MYRISKGIDIDFAHHIRGHQGACIHIHGHTWRFELVLQAAALDATGFVVDFGVLKRQVLTPCHALLDHGLALGADTFAEVREHLEHLGAELLASRSPAAAADSPSPTPQTLHGAVQAWPGGMKVAVFPFAPTSERLARWLYELAEQRLADERVAIAAARVYETQRPVESWAEFVGS